MAPFKTALAIFTCFAASAAAAKDICELQKILSKGGELAVLEGAEGVELILGKDAAPAATVLSTCKTTASSETPFTPVYSASKVATAALVMRLVEDNILSLDEPLAAYLPFWASNASAAPRANVTLRHCLSNTASVNTHKCTTDASSSPFECAKMVHDAPFSPADCMIGGLIAEAPGTSFCYNEGNWVVAAAVVVRATNSSNLDAAFQKFIARPLSMNASKCHFSFPSKANAAAGYGLVCTAQQYAIFMGNYFAGKLLQAASTTEMEADQTAGTGPEGWAAKTGAKAYGLGLWHRGETSLDSVGIAGFMPFIDRAGGFWGVLARAGAMGQGGAESVGALPTLHREALAFMASGSNESTTDGCGATPTECPRGAAGVPVKSEGCPQTMLDAGCGMAGMCFAAGVCDETTGEIDPNGLGGNCKNAGECAACFPKSKCGGAGPTLAPNGTTTGTPASTLAPIGTTTATPASTLAPIGTTTATPATPSASPSASPASLAPSVSPSASPTAAPSASPVSAAPSGAPTAAPTAAPTYHPCQDPDEHAHGCLASKHQICRKPGANQWQCECADGYKCPTGESCTCTRTLGDANCDVTACEATSAPTMAPTAAPLSLSPTASPSSAPASEAPSRAPTAAPSEAPTLSKSPTPAPVPAPTPPAKAKITGAVSFTGLTIAQAETPSFQTALSQSVCEVIGMTLGTDCFVDIVTVSVAGSGRRRRLLTTTGAQIDYTCWWPLADKAAADDAVTKLKSVSDAAFKSTVEANYVVPTSGAAITPGEFVAMQATVDNDISLVVTGAVAPATDAASNDNMIVIICAAAGGLVVVAVVAVLITRSLSTTKQNQAEDGAGGLELELGAAKSAESLAPGRFPDAHGDKRVLETPGRSDWQNQFLEGAAQAEKEANKKASNLPKV